MKLSRWLISFSVLYSLTCSTVEAAQHFHFSLQDCNNSFSTYGPYTCGVLFHSKEIGSWPIRCGEFHAPLLALFPPANLHAIIYRDHRALGMRPEVLQRYVQLGFRFDLASLHVTTAGVPGVTPPGPQADLMNLYDNKPV
ncbi:hypothetical protein [Endozoicomonas numazuensis]|uniref:hypothetical protein n=1 Tax=Endozoicomonas numazuensis TaxID=1137799 RepID=UPI0005514ACB|nr:hypothetical protein [Endozoicomonas numazuensis]